jgi:hypothetical protein
MLVGEFDPIKSGQMDTSASPQMAKVLFVAFVLLTSVVLLNLLIAIMGDSYEKVFERKIQTWMKQKATIVLDAELLNINEHGIVLSLGRNRKLLSKAMDSEMAHQFYASSKCRFRILTVVSFFMFGVLIVLPWVIVHILRPETETEAYVTTVQPWAIHLSWVYALLVVPFKKIPLFKYVSALKISLFKKCKALCNKDQEAELWVVYRILARIHRVHFLLFWLTLVVFTHEIVALVFGLVAELYRTPSLFGALWKVPGDGDLDDGDDLVKSMYTHVKEAVCTRMSKRQDEEAEPENTVSKDEQRHAQEAVDAENGSSCLVCSFVKMWQLGSHF